MQQKIVMNDDKSFRNVAEFQYLEMTVPYQNYIHKEVRSS